MMYTPSPTKRRPRPPGSIPRIREKSSPASLPTTSSHDDTPTSIHRRKRQISAQSALARISASPGDIGDVSLELDPGLEEDRIQQYKSLSSRIGLGLPSALSLPQGNAANLTEPSQPSPPPPYGTDLPCPPQTVSTPPSQDSDNPAVSIPPSPATSIRTISSAGEVEERLRVRRATDAARAMGLDMDFGGSDDGDGEIVGSEGSLSDGAVRYRLREIKRQLRRRDNELLMAARVAEQALRTHEQVVASLSPRAQSHMPTFMSLMSSTSSHNMHQTDASPSSNRYTQGPSPGNVTPHLAQYPHEMDPYQTLSSPLHIPSPMIASPPQRSSFSSLSRSSTHCHTRPVLKSSHSSSSPSTSNRHLALLQAESEERVATLESALNEARESEEAQRKLAARLRKNFDKLKRDFERAEERFAGVEEEGRRPVRRREHTDPRPVDEAYARHLKGPRGSLEVEVEVNEERVGWGSTAFPQYPAGTLRHIVAKKKRYMRETRELGDLDDNTGRYDTSSRIPEQRKIRNRISKSSFVDLENCSPRLSSPLAPRMRIRSAEASIARATPSATPARLTKSHSRESTSSTIRSHYPLRASDSASSPISTIRTVPSPSSQLSHNYSTLNSRMNIMREYTSSSIMANNAQARTLGSELGSQYGTSSNHADQGEQSDSEDTLHEFARIHQGTSSSSGGSTEEDCTSGDHVYAAPLPEGVSRALSSLAGALMRGGGGEATERMEDRRIRWSDPGGSRLEGLSRSAARPGLVRPSSERALDALPISRYGVLERPVSGRPQYDRSTSSTSTIALAHRRIVSPTSDARHSSAKQPSDNERLAVNPRLKTLVLLKNRKPEDPITIPGRLTHDIICLIAIILDWMECAFVIIYRIVMDMKYSERSQLGLSERARRKRYYL